MRNLPLEETMVLFKTFAVLKIAFLALLTKIFYKVVKELEKIQKRKNSSPKIKRKTTCKDYVNDCLKTVVISCKIVSLQCS